ncbi:MAG: hypothetical protein IBX61_04635 [Thermoleophilia bacterium]|nr:hypothetical protein [Thermoleophilia bacterium]
MKRLNEAYALILSYCEEYPISFRQEAGGYVESCYDFQVKRFYENFFL